MSWGILGAGSIGCLFAHHLTQADQPCALLLRDEHHAKAYRSAGGITLYPPETLEPPKAPKTLEAIVKDHDRRPDGNHQDHQPVNTTTQNYPFKSTPYALTPNADDKNDRLAQINTLLITTKAHQTESALAPYLPKLSDTLTVILLQNGMGVAELVQQLLPKAHLLLATTTEGANRKGPFVINYAGIGTTWIGASNPSALPPCLKTSIVKPLQASGLDARWDNDIEQKVWLKLAINCAINGLAVIHNCKNGKLISDSASAEELDGLISEIEMLYEKCQPQLAPLLRDQIHQVIQKTAENICSTLQDWRQQRPTELPFLNGYLLKVSHQYHITLPLHVKLMQKIAQRSKPFR